MSSDYIDIRNRLKNGAGMLAASGIVILLYTCSPREEEIPDPLFVSGSISHVTEFGGNDGYIDLIVSGGLTPYYFLWSSGEYTEDISQLKAGVYSVIVTDAAKQRTTDTFEVNQPVPPPLEITFEIINPSVTGSGDGSVNTSVKGGSPPFTFFWSNGKTTEDLENIPAGTYILRITDQAGQSLADTAILYDLLTDIDGNTYHTIKTGTQIWMKENLRVTHAPDGKEITSYLYNNNSSLAATYGRLYTWDAVMNGSKIPRSQGICPDGWHVPDDEEVKALEIHLGMTRTEADLSNVWRGTGVGTAMKIGGSSGFEALLSGRRSSGGSYSFLDRVEYFWTSSESGNSYAWRRCLDKYADDVGRYDTFPKSYGFSVRCIKND